MSSTRIPRGVWMLGLVSLLMDLSSEMIHSLLPVYVVTVLGAGTLWLGLIEGIAEGQSRSATDLRPGGSARRIARFSWRIDCKRRPRGRRRWARQFDRYRPDPVQVETVVSMVKRRLEGCVRGRSY